MRKILCLLLALALCACVLAGCAGGDEAHDYNIELVDENGDPVDGVTINICTDRTCTPVTVEGGRYGFDADEPYPFVVHVLSVPEGCMFDTAQEFVMDAAGGTLVITIPHA